MHEPSLTHNMCTVQLDTEPTIQTDIDTLLEEAGPPPPLLSQEKSLSVEVSETLTVRMWKADLTSFTVDAIVNAANMSLRHTGGLALALATAGEKPNLWSNHPNPPKAGGSLHHHRRRLCICEDCQGGI